jgi:hypothetical protein
MKELDFLSINTIIDLSVLVVQTIYIRLQSSLSLNINAFPFSSDIIAYRPEDIHFDQYPAALIPYICMRMCESIPVS